jgi:hypothetical protein
MAITPNTEGNHMNADRYRISIRYLGGGIKTEYQYRTSMSAARKTAEILANSDRVRRVVADPIYRVRGAVVVIQGRVTDHDNYGRAYHNPGRGWVTLDTVEAPAQVAA